MKANLVLIIGTRPELLKFAPVLRFLTQLESAHHFSWCALYTGQHWDPMLWSEQQQALNLPSVNWQRINLSPAEHQHLGRELLWHYLRAIKDKLNEMAPKAVMVQGDTTSALAGALAAASLRYPLIHLEAGCRSFLDDQVEEQHRRLIDHLSQYNLAMDGTCAEHLKAEGLGRTVSLLPNTGLGNIDREWKVIAPELKNADQDQDYILVTLHRQENIDDPARLEHYLNFFSYIAGIGHRLRWVLHPRVQQKHQERLKQWQSILGNSVQLLAPQSYHQFLVLLKGAKIVCSDSGGVVLESVYFERPLCILRESTEYREELRDQLALLLPTTLTAQPAVAWERAQHFAQHYRPRDASATAAQLQSLETMGPLRKIFYKLNLC